MIFEVNLAANRKRNPIIVASISIMFLLACSSVTVKSDYNPDVDFNNYRTYHWAEFEKMNEDELANILYYVNPESLQKAAKQYIIKIFSDFPSDRE